MVEAYDSDKRFPVIGFGAILKENMASRTVSHCFSIASTPDGLAPGIKGVLESYHQIFTKGIKLYGPTKFSVFLDQLISRVQAKGPCPEYNVFVILTDGMIHDMQETVDQIVRAAFLPISIIIIGVGSSEELDDMKTLDADTKALVNSQGQPSPRDTVQFVKFNDYKSNPEKLAEEVLKEIPNQMTAFLAMMKVAPQ